MFRFTVWFCLVSAAICVNSNATNPTSVTRDHLECPEGFRHRSRSVAFFQWETLDAGRLSTLQDFLENKTTFVTLSLDFAVPIPRGTPICIPEYNRKFRRNVVFQYGDNSIEELEGKMYSRCAVCVRDQNVAHEIIVNQYVTLVIPKVVIVNETGSPATDMT